MRLQLEYLFAEYPADVACSARWEVTIDPVAVILTFIEQLSTPIRDLPLRCCDTQTYAKVRIGIPLELGDGALGVNASKARPVPPNNSRHHEVGWSVSHCPWKRAHLQPLRRRHFKFRICTMHAVCTVGKAVLVMSNRSFLPSREPTKQK